MRFFFFFFSCIVTKYLFEILVTDSFARELHMKELFPYEYTLIFLNI